MFPFSEQWWAKPKMPLLMSIWASPWVSKLKLDLLSSILIHRKYGPWQPHPCLRVMSVTFSQTYYCSICFLINITGYCFWQHSMYSLFRLGERRKSLLLPTLVQLDVHHCPTNTLWHQHLRTAGSTNPRIYPIQPIFPFPGQKTKIAEIKLRESGNLARYKSRKKNKR